MEAENIRDTVGNVLWALNEAKIQDYELLIIDCLRLDGTHDGTPAIADALARDNDKIRVFHNSFINLGAKYWMGVNEAKYPYFILVPGDNELVREALRDLLLHLDEADVLISYPVNTRIRPLYRRILSTTYIKLVNFSTGLNLRYYNGSCIHRTDVLKKIESRDAGLTYMARLLIRLIKKGYSYKEVPIYLQERRGKPSVLTVRNFLNVGKSIFDLFWQYKVLGQ